MNPLVSTLLTLTAVGIASAATWATLWHKVPSLPLLLYDLLTLHPWLAGGWLALTVIAADYSAAAARNTLGYRNVGAKAGAHWRLSSRGDK